MDMENLFKKLPKVKLSRLADWKIKFRLYVLIWQKKLKTWKINFVPPRLAPIMTSIVLLCVIIAVPGFVYASEEITQGNILYPLKLFIERVEVGFPQSETAKIKTYEKLADRRLEEAKILSQKSSSNAKNNLMATIKEAVNLSGQAANLNVNLQSDNNAQIISQSEDKQINKLDEVAKNIGLGGDDEIIDTLTLAFDNIKNKKIKRNNYPLSGDRPTAATTTASEDEIIFSATTTEDKQNDARNKFKQQAGFKNTIRRATNTPDVGSISSTTAAREYLKTIETKIDVLGKELDAAKIDPVEYKKLFNRLDDKIEKARAAINGGNLNQYNGLIKSTEALTDNAKHFIKNNNQNKSLRQTDNSGATSTDNIDKKKNSGWRNRK